MTIENLKLTEDQKTFSKGYIDQISTSDSKSQNDLILIGLFESLNNNTATKAQISSIERILKNEFKKHKINLTLQKAKEEERKILANVKKQVATERNKDRKKREHHLITVGALFDMVGFDIHDRGLITGMLLDTLDKSKTDKDLFSKLKIIGDQFIHDREQEKKQKKTVIDNSGSPDNA